MTTTGLYHGLEPLVADVWSNQASIESDVYFYYSHDVDLGTPMHDTKRQAAFVDGLWTGLDEAFDDVGLIAGTRNGRREGRPAPVWLFPQDAEHNLDRRCWINFYHIYRHRAHRPTTHRVYARFDEPYATNAVAGALAVATNKGLPTSTVREDWGIWEGVNSLKVAAPGASNRRDHLVVYLTSADFVEPVANLLRDAQARGQTRLRAGLPPGVGIIDATQPGVGTAAEPPRLQGRNRSFGSMLANVVATAYRLTKHRDLETFTAEVVEGLWRAGIRADAPYLPVIEAGRRTRNPRTRGVRMGPADDTLAYADTDPRALEYH